VIEMHNRYNEIEYAKAIESNGFLSRFKKHELRVLAKYYKSQGVKNAELKELICEFCERHIPNYNEVRYASFINGIINFASKKTNKLIVIKDIPIAGTEGRAIDKLDIGYEYKRFLFAWLVKVKLNRAIYKISHDAELKSIYFSHEVARQKEIFKMSNLDRKEYNMNEIIKHLYDKGIIDIANNGKIKLLFMENMTEGKKISLRIPTTDIDYAGYYWDQFKKKYKVGYCQECGIIIKKKNISKKYCQKCGKKIKNLQTNQSKKAKRQKEKNMG
jgi:hypothetical protein